ncbi:hypothetical protein [Kitasatospora cheerisanensis]|uniref:Uncharacterized protein n=1 Tax=Kitasatospora cheerisanensis KCTC 2395 TaxID=1348663 RepID=A0A066Z825_9ACTN|nr:hypothetical protein [Kitasatospora cheerisanensis]KDN86310.1 hypothetical protein KCH_21270 [Kitasatospora cheerisanensis KCTC 2395]
MAFVQPPPPAPRAGARGLPGIGVLLLIQVVVELAILGYDLSQAGVHYLPIALGVPLDAQYFVPAPVMFTGLDTALVVASLVLAFAAFGRRPWARAGAVVACGLKGYIAATGLITLLIRDSDVLLDRGFAWTLLSATMVVNVLIALVVALVAVAGREPSTPVAGPYGNRPPLQSGWGVPHQPPAPAAGYQPPYPGQQPHTPPPPRQQPQHPPVDRPQQPAAEPGAAYAYPPPPPAPPAPPAQPPGLS